MELSNTNLEKKKKVKNKKVKKVEDITDDTRTNDKTENPKKFEKPKKKNRNKNNATDQENANEEIAVTIKKTKKKKTKKDKPEEKEEDTLVDESPRKKRKAENELSSPSKKLRIDDNLLRLCITNISPKTTEEKLQSSLGIDEITIVKERPTKVVAFGCCDASLEKNMKSKNGVILDGQELQIEVTPIDHNSRTLKVLKLSFSTDQDTLKNAFQGAISAEILKDRKKRSMGKGIVTFASLSDALKAQEKMFGKQIDGRNVTFNFETDTELDGTEKSQKTKFVPCSTLMVANLSYFTVEADLLHHFLGAIKAQVITNKESQESKGFGFVQYGTIEEATRAIRELHGHEIDGRKITVRFSQSAASQHTSHVSESPTTMLMVHNIAKEATNDSLKYAFPDATLVKITIDDFLKRIAYIEFDNITDSKKAKVTMSGQQLDGETLQIEYISHIKHKHTNAAGKTFGDRDANNPPSTTLVIRNLSNNTTVQSLGMSFKGAVDVRLPRSQNGEHKGFGFVEFKFLGQAIFAQKKMHQQLLDGRVICVYYVSEKNRVGKSLINVGMNSPLQPDHENPPSNVLMVRNLSYQVAEADLLNTFSDAVSAQIAIDQRGKSRGFGFVDFQTIADATKARKKMNERPICGRKVYIVYRRPKDENVDKGQ